MALTMKRRKMARWLENLNTILTNPSVDAYTARQQAVSLLANVFPPAPKTKPANPAVANLRSRRRSSRNGTTTMRAGIGIGATTVNIPGSVCDEIATAIGQEIPGSISKRIQAIKLLRTTTGLGLKEAKDIIDYHFPIAR